MQRFVAIFSRLLKVGKVYQRYGSKKVLSGGPGQVDFLAVQLTFKG